MERAALRSTSQSIFSLFLGGTIVLLGLLPQARASGGHVRSKLDTQSAELYQQPTTPALLKKNAAEFERAWDAPERDSERVALKGVIDVDAARGLNLQAAETWDELVSCQHGDQGPPQVQALYGYLSGQLCTGGTPEESARVANRIRGLQLAVVSFTSTSWIGGNQAPVNAELPAGHPFLSQVLLERTALRLKATSLEWDVQTADAVAPPRDSDHTTDSKNPSTNSWLNQLLLLRLMPASMGILRGGFYPTATFACTSLALENTAGANTDTAGWKLALLTVQQSAVPYTGDSHWGYWDYVQLYQWLATRYGVHDHGQVAPPKKFNILGWVFSGGIRYRDKRYPAFYMVPFAPAMAVEYGFSALRGEPGNIEAPEFNKH